MSKGTRVCTSMISQLVPCASSITTASCTIRSVEPYDTIVTSVPSFIVSGTPKGTVYSSKLEGSFSLRRYPFRHSITSPGSLLCNNVLYIPTACVIFLGTQMYIPRSALITIPIGDPLCQLPSRRCPLVRTINGQDCCPPVR